MYSDKVLIENREVRDVDLHLIDTRSCRDGGTYQSQWNESALLDYWRALLRRKRTIVCVACAGLALSIIASLVQTRLYEATGRISVGRESANVLGAKDSQDTSGDIPEYNMFLDAQVRILQSNTLLLQVGRELHWLDNIGISDLEDKARATTIQGNKEAAIIRNIHSRLKVARVPRTGPIIEIQYSDPDPRKAAGFVNGLIDAYVNHNFQTKYEAATQASNWLTGQLQELKRKVESSQQEMVNYEKQTGILGTDEKQNIVTAKLDDLNKELTAAETDRIQKQAIYENAISSDPELLPGMNENPIIQNLKQRQAELESQYAQAKVQMGAAHPKIIELKNQLDQTRSTLHAELGKLATTSRTAYLISVKRERALRAALESQKGRANRLNESAIQYDMLKHDLQSNQQLYDGLQQKLREAGIFAGLRGSNVEIVDHARVPPHASSPNIPFNLGVGVFLGTLVGAILAFIFETVDPTLRTASDIQSTTALKPLAVIPALTSDVAAQLGITPGCGTNEKRTVELITYSNPKSDLAECYRALRTSLLLSSVPRPKVILITSSLAHEGKTTTAVNCAIVLAQKGTRVLLIDADLRGPRIHKVLRLGSPRAGLSSLLSGSQRLHPADVIIQSAQLPTLFVMPAGPVPDLPAELLDSSEMNKLLSQWRDQFDQIVIDTPPVLSATESVALSRQADCVLLTVRSGVTPKDALVRSRDLLLGVGAKLIGVLVNAADLHDSNLRYSDHYSFYDGAVPKQCDSHSFSRQVGKGFPTTCE